MTATCIGCGAEDADVAEAEAHWLRVDHIKHTGVCSSCQPYVTAWDVAHAFGPPHFDLVAHLYRQRMFSLATFGPDPRTNGVIAHIRKELIEIEAAPADLMEWIDVVMLALDGACRPDGVDRRGHARPRRRLARRPRARRHRAGTGHQADQERAAPMARLAHRRAGQGDRACAGGRVMGAQVMICGVDCHPGDANCNGYCTGKVDSPPAATPAMVLERKRQTAHRALEAAEKAWYEFYGECEVGQERTWAAGVYERLRRVRTTL